MISDDITMCCTILALFLAAVFGYKRFACGKKKACIVVLGDIGRSPRMQNHALSLVKHRFNVYFIGYRGSRPHEDILMEERISLNYLIQVPGILQGLPRLVVYVVKVLWQSVALFVSLLVKPKTAYLLLQNPPCIPSLAVCWVVCLLQNTKLVVDWHNYGYTILGLAVGANHPLVKFSKWYERFFGRLVQCNICVTDAMREDLKRNWSISATTMHDKPPAKFHSASLEEQHDLFTRLMVEYEAFSTRCSPEKGSLDETAFTQKTPSGNYIKKQCRPALIVSSTSWTEDEDFSLLLKALQSYEALKSGDILDLPDLVCAITGKGPQKEFYKREIDRLSMQHVQICTPWLEAEEYPTLLGSADLGICLHKSSSGLDLPMKVVDMFGCGLPVCAIDFNCLSELVKDDYNGAVFHSSEELAMQLQDLMRGFPQKCKTLDRYRENLKSFQSVRWDQAWDEHVCPIFQN